jgi:hypothetical protein
MNRAQRSSQPLSRGKAMTTPVTAPSRGAHLFAILVAAASLLAACGGGAKGDARYPERPKGCDVKLFHGKVIGAVYDDIGRVDAICGTDIGVEACMTELKDQSCKLGGDIVYDVPNDPEKPSPDKVRYTGRVAHTRAAR